MSSCFSVSPNVRAEAGGQFLLALAEEENAAGPLQSLTEEVVLDSGVLLSDVVARGPGGTDSKSEGRAVLW